MLVRRGAVGTLNLRQSQMVMIALRLLLILSLVAHAHQSATRAIIVDIIISIYIILVPEGNTVLNLEHLFLRVWRVRRIRDAANPIVILLTRSQSLAHVNIVPLNFVLQFLIVFKLSLEQLLVLQDLLLEEHGVNLITVIRRQLQQGFLRRHGCIHLLLFIGATVEHVHVLMGMVQQPAVVFLGRVDHCLLLIFLTLVGVPILCRRLVDHARALVILRLVLFLLLHLQVLERFVFLR